MAGRIILVLPVLFSIQSVVSVSKLGIVQSSATDLLECWVDKQPSECLEERTIKSLHGLTGGIKQEMRRRYEIIPERQAKALDEQVAPEEMEQIRNLETENRDMVSTIRSKDGQSNSGLIDEISDLFTYGFAKILNYLSPEKQTDEDLTEKIIQEADGRNLVEGRGHKKKYLKKQNKHLKVILLLMLIKNKVKMFMHKITVLLQLKFLGIAVINLLVNLARLWLELKKHHKPHKVVYYENAHHQHHYDHEHVHDHDDHYGYPGSHSHHSHHEEEYGGGPWPWSRSYIEQQSEQAFQKINSQNNNNNNNNVPPATSHSLVYMKQRPIR